MHRNRISAEEFFYSLDTKTVRAKDLSENNSTEHVNCTSVKFSLLTAEEILYYVTYSDEYKWRAGCYSMFDRASVFIESISGSPSNVIGLPMEFVYSQLKKLGLNLLKIEEK